MDKLNKNKFIYEVFHITNEYGYLIVDNFEVDEYNLFINNENKLNIYVNKENNYIEMNNIIKIYCKDEIMFNCFLDDLIIYFEIIENNTMTLRDKYEDIEKDANNFIEELIKNQGDKNEVK